MFGLSRSRIRCSIPTGASLGCYFHRKMTIDTSCSGEIHGLISDLLDSYKSYFDQVFQNTDILFLRYYCSAYQKARLAWFSRTIWPACSGFYSVSDGDIGDLGKLSPDSISREDAEGLYLTLEDVSQCKTLRDAKFMEMLCQPRAMLTELRDGRLKLSPKLPLEIELFIEAKTDVVREESEI